MAQKNPTSISQGLPPDVAQMVRNAQQATDANRYVKIEILYDFKLGVCRVGAPADPIMFHGILEAARETFKGMMAELQKQEAEKRIHTPNDAPPQEIPQ